MGARREPPKAKDITPGPNAYKTERVKLNHHSPPKAYMGIRHSDLCLTIIPPYTSK